MPRSRRIKSGIDLFDHAGYLAIEIKFDMTVQLADQYTSAPRVGLGF
jgi:hypothetical protein